MLRFHNIGRPMFLPVGIPDKKIGVYAITSINSDLFSLNFKNYSSTVIFFFISSISSLYLSIGLNFKQIRRIIPVSAGAPKRRKFNAISVLSGCCPIAPAMYPDAARTARIPEFVTVPPHFCANPLIEEITPFAENPSFN